MTVQTLKPRDEIAREYTWKLETIFPNNADWELAFQSLQQRLPELEALQGVLVQSGAALLQVLRTKDEVFESLEKLYVYASLRKDEDTTDGLYVGMADRAMQLYIRAATAISFLEPEILALPPETLDLFLRETPELQLYKHQLDDLNRNRAHVRSAEVEAVLAAAAQMAEGPSSIYTMIDNADLILPTIIDENGNETPLTKGNYQVYRESVDQRLRKDAFEALHNAYLQQRHTIAATLASQVKADIFYAQQHGYAASREQALSNYNIPTQVYDNLIDTVSEHIPLLNRYLRLRKRVLQLDELHMYDLYVPIVPEVAQEVSFEMARDTVLQALAPLGENYGHMLKRAFSERWIDVYETPGKRSGAYSGGTYGTNPFILLNFQNNRDSMFTLAHELGHSMHSFFTRTNQPYPYGNYTIFVAEVASTLNEGLLTEYLLRTTSDAGLRLAILNHSLEGFRGTLFRQTMFAEFELQVHERAEQGEPMTADTLSAMYRALNRKYYGGEVIIDDLIDIEWARIPHFFSSFYVYQYATGISAASALVQKILREGKEAVDRYQQFLCSGSSDYSIDLLKKAGVDMTSPEPVRQALQLFEAHLDQLEQLLLSNK